MKIVALDIGSYSIKAVDLDVTFGRVELSDYLIERVTEERVVEPVPQNAESEGAAGKAEQQQDPKRQLLTAGQAAAIRRLLSDRRLQSDKLVVNFPKAWITTRLFNFPTKDRKTIQSSLAFELDDDIPFSMEDIVYDFTILGGEGAQSTVFACVALKKDLSALLAELQELGLDPEAVTVECWALGQVLRRSIPKEYEGRPVCIINMGHDQTSVHMYVAESPVLTHVSACAGRDVTQAIAQAYKLDFGQADKAKTDGAFLLTQTHFASKAEAAKITEDQKQFSSTIADALMPMVREIKQTLMAYKSQYKMAPRAIFITGGTSLIQNMPLFLEESLRIPVFHLSYMTRIVGQTLQLSESSEMQVSTSTGLALSSIKPDRNANINFRKDLFAKRTGLGSIDWRQYRRPLKFAALSLAFVYCNFFAQGLILSRMASNQDSRLERSIKSVVGAVSASVMSTYKASPSTLKGAVNKEIAKYKETQPPPARSALSALDVLNKVSASIPRDMTLDVTSFQVKEGKLRVAGVVDQKSNAARIEKALEETKLLTDLKKDVLEEDPKLKKVKFDFSAKIAEAPIVKTR